jgi:hypothetical protein
MKQKITKEEKQKAMRARQPRRRGPKVMRTGWGIPHSALVRVQAYARLLAGWEYQAVADFINSAMKRNCCDADTVRYWWNANCPLRG